MQLTADEKASLLRKGDKGHQHYSCCPVCGFLEWRMTETNKPDDVTVEEDAYRTCFRCQDVHNRAPEVVDWIMAVLGYQERKKKN